MFDSGAGKLRLKHSGEPINLALSYPSRMVAAEMRGLALRINTVAFSTMTSPALSQELGASNLFSTTSIFQEQVLLYKITRLPEFSLDKLEASCPGASRLWPFV